MARGSATYTQGTGSLAVYKGWAQALSQVLNQAKARTSDTGQVDWATIATEPAGTVRDYEIFAMGGSLQATAPIFLRVDYTGGANATASLTVGTTTDGAGNLGGLTVTKVALQNHAISTQSGLGAWAACDGEYFTCLYALDPSASGTDGVGMFVVERTRDIAGAATAAGFHVWRWQAASATTTTFLGGWSRVYAAAVQTANPDYNLGVTLPDAFSMTTGVDTSTNIAYSYPAYTYTFAQPGGASKALLCAFPADYPRGQAVPVTHYGASTTFVTLADSVVQTIATMNSSNAVTTKGLAPLIRWD